MADIRTTNFFDLTTAVNPEYPMRVGDKWGPMDVSYDENVKFNNFEFGAHHDTDKGNGLWWSLNKEAIYTGDVEAWGQLTGGEFGVAGEGWRIGLFDAGSLGLGISSFRGYVATVFHALGDYSVIRKYTGNGAFTEAAAGGGSPPWGGYLLIRRRGNAIEMYDGDSTGVTWNFRCSFNDIDYMNVMIGFGCEDPTHGGLGWTSVGGGQKNRQYIYRVLRAQQGVPA